MAADANLTDRTEHPQWDELYAEALAMRLEDGELRGPAELRAVVDVVGFLRATGAIPAPD